MVSGQVPEDILAEAKRVDAYRRCGQRQRSALVPYERCGSRKVYAVRFPRAELHASKGDADRKRIGYGPLSTIHVLNSSAHYVYNPRIAVRTRTAGGTRFDNLALLAATYC